MQDEPKPHKPSLLEMVLQVEAEAERLETWVRIAVQPESRAMMERRAVIFRGAANVLDLVREHQSAVTEAIKSAKAAKGRRAK